MAQWSLVALLEEVGSIPYTHMVADTIYNSSLGNATPLLASTGTAHMWCTDIHAHKIPIHINKIIKDFKRFIFILCVYVFIYMYYKHHVQAW